MRKGADGDSSKWPKVKLQRSLNGGLTWMNVTTNAYNEPITPLDVPSGLDTDTGSQTYGQYLDGQYEMDNDNGSGAGTIQHPYTWQYLPMYPVHGLPSSTPDHCRHLLRDKPLCSFASPLLLIPAYDVNNRSEKVHKSPRILKIEIITNSDSIPKILDQTTI